MPKLLGIEGKPAMRDDGIFTPHEAYGMKVMSIGSMLEGDQAVVWRGPMATSALRQLVRETDWGEIDTLVIDLPPGTGDVHISLVQTVPLTGAIVCVYAARFGAHRREKSHRHVQAHKCA